MIEYQAARCRHCGKILLISVPGLVPHLAEYVEKVILHEADCDGSVHA